MTEGTSSRTVPPIASHYRLPAFLLWGYLALKSLSFWAAHTEPLKAHNMREYVRSSILPSHFKNHQTLFDTVYHEPAWKVLLPVILFDAALFALLYGTAWRLDYRTVLALRKGHQLSGPVLHYDAKKFQKAICKH